VKAHYFLSRRAC